MLDFSKIRYIILTRLGDKYNTFDNYLPFENLERAEYEAEAHLAAYKAMNGTVKATAFIFETNLIKVLEDVENVEN